MFLGDDDIFKDTTNGTWTTKDPFLLLSLNLLLMRKIKAPQHAYDKIMELVEMCI
jgi:hypothetical protein